MFNINTFTKILQVCVERYKLDRGNSVSAHHVQYLLVVMAVTKLESMLEWVFWIGVLKEYKGYLIVCINMHLMHQNLLICD